MFKGTMCVDTNDYLPLLHTLRFAVDFTTDSAYGFAMSYVRDGKTDEMPKPKNIVHLLGAAGILKLKLSELVSKRSITITDQTDIDVLIEAIDVHSEALTHEYLDVAQGNDRIVEGDKPFDEPAEVVSLVNHIQSINRTKMVLETKE